MPTSDPKPTPAKITPTPPSRRGHWRWVSWVAVGTLSLGLGAFARAAVPRIVAETHRSADEVAPPPRFDAAPRGSADAALGDRLADPTRDDGDVASREVGLPPPNAVEDAEVEVTPAPETTPEPDPHPDPELTGWRRLLADGASAEAWAMARSEGPERAARSGRPAELLALADAGRHIGETRGAARVYETIRERFPGQRAAAASAYQLGRIAFGRREFRAAAVWFHTYVDEVGDGERLARDARGRELESLHRAGDRAQATEAARRYLNRYPAGPWARMARGILED